jgi:large subunit ribosomal protein L37e
MKGTPSFGKHNKIVHIRCRRCGNHSYNIKTSVCASCGFGKSSKIKKYNWKTKNVTKTKRIK